MGWGRLCYFPESSFRPAPTWSRGVASYDPQQVRAFFVRTVQDPGVACLTQAAAALWYLGYRDQALKKIQEALTLAQELSHPFSLVWTLNNVARQHQLRREGHLTQEWAAGTITLSRKQGFPFWLAQGTILRGWALTEQGQGEEGIVQIRQGLAAWQATGTELWRSYFLALLAEACGKVGQAKEGLTVLAEALTAMDKSQARLWEAELYRLKGKLSLKSRQVKANPEFEVRSRQSPAPNAQPPSGGGSRSVFSQSNRDRSQTAGEVAGVARDDEPDAVVAATG